MGYTSTMAYSDPSVHIQDLITVYQMLPPSVNRNKVLAALKQAFLYATADELAAVTGRRQELQPEVGDIVLYCEADDSTGALCTFSAILTAVDGDLVTMTVFHPSDIDVGVTSAVRASHEALRDGAWLWPN